MVGFKTLSDLASERAAKAKEAKDLEAAADASRRRLWEIKNEMEAYGNAAPEPLWAWEPRQGGNAIVIRDRVCYPNGARRDFGDIVRTAPPTDRRALALRRRIYFEAKLARTEADVAKLSLALDGGPVFKWPVDRYGPPLPTGEAALQHLHDMAENERRTLAEIEAVIRSTTPLGF